MGRTILLVEDNRVNADMLSRRLKRCGFEVVVAEDGLQAVAVSRTRVPDLILMDIRLPEIDGWEATRRVKADPTTTHIPVIALSALALLSDQEQSLAAGCDDFETKPVALARLLGKIDRLLARAASRSSAV